MRLRIDGQPLVGLLDLAEQRVDLRQTLHFVAEQLDAKGVVVVGGVDLDDVAAHAERPAAEIDVVAFVEDLDQLGHDFVARDLLPLLQHQQHAVISFGRAQAVNAAHAGHDDAIAPLEQRFGRREPQLVELVVGGGFLLDIDVAGGDVRFRLVVVVVADEVLDRVFGEERLEFVVELRGERLIVGQDQCRPAGGLDHLGHGEGLSGSRDAEQNLVLLPLAHPPREFLDSGFLIAPRAVVYHQTKAHNAG